MLQLDNVRLESLERTDSSVGGAFALEPECSGSDTGSHQHSV